MLTIGANELLIYTRNSHERGGMRGFCGNSPVQSMQYQQGNNTTFRQQTHPGMDFFASRSEIVFHAASRASLAFRSVLAKSRLKRIR